MQKTLSSLEFEGRGVGTKGLEKARDLLVSEYKRIGIVPAFKVKDRASDALLPSYTQELRVFVGNELAPGNSFADAPSAEFIPLAFSKSGQLKQVEVVFVGFGISVRQAGDFIYDDYDGQNVKGKIVIAFQGDPGTGNRDSKFRNPAYYHYSSPLYKVQNAELHEAAGIILVRDPLSLAGNAEPPLQFQSRQGGGSSFSLLVGQSSLKYMETFLGKSLKDIQDKIAKNQKPFSFSAERKADLRVNLIRNLGNVENVAAFIPGTDPNYEKQVIVIGAHYDHLGYGGDSSMDHDAVGKVHPGADDNASGVQAVLHIAEKLKNEKTNRHPILLVLFTAEEIGLLGSKYFTENLPLPPEAKISAMINLDMVGRLDKNKLSVLALRSAKEFDSLIGDVNKKFNFEILKGDSGFGSSDHANFLQMKIPTLFFTTGAHEDYHRPSDTFDKINQAGMEKVEGFVLATLHSIDALPNGPTYDPSSEDTLEPPRQGRGYGVYFGSIPEFKQSEIEGVLLQGVRAGSPAEKVGLKSGDILTGLGEIKIKNLYDLVFALRFYRPNEEVDVNWIRGKEKMSGKTILKSREQ